MVRFTNDFIEKIKKKLNENNARAFGRGYMKTFQGQRMEHVTMEYKIRNPNDKRKFLTKYMSVPYEALQKAERRIRLTRFSPVKTVTTEAKYGGKGSIKQQIYKGKFTKGEITATAQRISNTLNDRGKRGKISIALNFYGQYRTAGLTDFGALVKTYEPEESDWIEELPDNFDGFALNVVYQN